MKVLLNNQEIDYEIRRSKRARLVRLAIKPGVGLVVTLPGRVADKQAELFIKQKAHWVLKHLTRYQQQGTSEGTRLTKVDYLKNKVEAKKLIESRVNFFNRYYQFKFKRISIKNQSTRWGSCSRSGNLNFNFKLIFLPQILVDYVVVHELCHLQELNHSARFWNLVAKALPNYQELRRDLKRAGWSLM